MNDSFRLGPDGIYRCDALQEFVWQRHGFGTRLSNPDVDVTLRQVHSSRVVNAASSRDRELEGDALVTDQIGMCIGVRSADCVPIVLLDVRCRAVGAVHAGWRGTAEEVATRSIKRMRELFGSEAADIYAAIGPCIRGCCYDVGPDVAEQFTPFFPEWEPTAGHRKVNLAEANRRQMERAGVRQDRIFDCGLCTLCEPAQFFSHRREPENPGRMVASICRLA